MILESIVTTVDPQGRVNIAPLGPIVLPPPEPAGLPAFLLRPWRGSRTRDNLIQTRRAVIHVTDDVLLIAKTAIGSVSPDGLVCSIGAVNERTRGFQRLVDCHRWFAVEVIVPDDVEADRLELTAQCLVSGEVRPFFGFNRAMHAVIELAILATRLHLVGDAEVRSELARWKIVVEKTAGPRERAAFELLERHLQNHRASDRAGRPS